MYQDYSQTVATGMSDALHLMSTIMHVGSVLSLLIGVSPMLWGQIRVKWVVTALTSCIMFGIMGLMLSMFAGPMPPSPASVSATPTATVATGGGSASAAAGGTLPATGGGYTSALSVGMGALLIAGGLLARRIAR